jgi:hypothetical protein
MPKLDTFYASRINYGSLAHRVAFTFSASWLYVGIETLENACIFGDFRCSTLKPIDFDPRGRSGLNVHAGNPLAKVAAVAVDAFRRV